MKDCGSLPTPANGAQASTGTRVGFSTTFSCDPGYDVQGSATRVCQIDCTWSGSDASCTCKLLFIIINRLIYTMAVPYTISMMSMGRFSGHRQWCQQSSLDDHCDPTIIPLTSIAPTIIASTIIAMMPIIPQSHMHDAPPTPWMTKNQSSASLCVHEFCRDLNIASGLMTNVHHAIDR